MTGKWVEHLYVRPAASDGGSRRDIRNVRNSEKPKLRNSVFTYRRFAAEVPDATSEMSEARNSEITQFCVTYHEKKILICPKLNLCLRHGQLAGGYVGRPTACWGPTPNPGIVPQILESMQGTLL
ncbi:hypothetical protein C8J57DRAFT_1229072 [Mycena rebaudengoi]|nr:hypothetical protein C8J57DRAFT_1229072 [Mycena rebaudengoi]